MEQLQEFTAPDSPAAGSSASLTPQELAHAVNSCAATLAKGFDRKLGGFGPAPKFPRPSEINLLLRAATAQVGLLQEGFSQGPLKPKEPFFDLIPAMH
jgi:uncharacterized protein YyaL (SSP411 family)